MCNLQLRRQRHHLHGAELGAFDPAFIMRAGLGPTWNRENPRHTLTDVSAVTQQQSHPLGEAPVVISRGKAGKSRVAHDFSVLSWLRGDYR